MSERRLTNFKEKFTRVALALGLLTSAYLGTLQANQFTAPPDPVLGGSRFEETILGRNMLCWAGEIEKSNLPPELARVVHLSPRVIPYPELILYYIQEAIGDLLSRPFPENIPFSQAFPLKGKEVELPGWVQNEANTLQATEYEDSINGHRIRTITIPLQGSIFKLLLPWKQTGTLTSPNKHLAAPNPDERNEDNLFYTGTNPDASHANAGAIEIIIGNIKIVFGFGWHKISPTAPECLEDTTIFYGLLNPNNLAMPGTAIWEIRDGEVIKYSDYAGDLNSENPPVFLYLTAQGIEVLQGEEVLEVIENPENLSDGYIIQIAHAERIPDRLLNEINELKQLTKQDKQPTIQDLQKAKEDYKKMEEKINNIEAYLHNRYTITKDVVWVILVKTESGKQYLTLVVNRENESERTPGSYKITAGILEATKNSGDPDDPIEALYIISVGAEGSTANVIFSRAEGNPPPGTKTFETPQELLEYLKSQQEQTK